MTTPAPYTRETLDRIRKGASPESIGWSLQRYQSVCRSIGIEPKIVVAAEFPPPTPPRPVLARPRPPVEHCKRGGIYKEFHDLSTRIMAGDRIDRKQKFAASFTAPAGKELITLSRRYGISPTGFLSLLGEAVFRQGIAELILGLETGDPE